MSAEELGYTKEMAGYEGDRRMERINPELTDGAYYGPSRGHLQPRWARHVGHAPRLRLRRVDGCVGARLRRRLGGGVGDRRPLERPVPEPGASPATPPSSPARSSRHGSTATRSSGAGCTSPWSRSTCETRTARPWRTRAWRSTSRLREWVASLRRGTQRLPEPEGGATESRRTGRGVGSWRPARTTPPAARWWRTRRPGRSSGRGRRRCCGATAGSTLRRPPVRGR